MREIIKRQMELGEVDIGAIEISTKSRDDIPRLLRGLQYIYTTDEVRERVFEILAEVVPQRADGEGAVSTETGRPGMSQWQILVLGVLRLGLNADYDRIGELANEHRTVRQMLGHAEWCEESVWHVQTIKDNLRLFTPEILDRINQVVVEAGHALVKKSPHEGLAVRCDSFVVETDVHFPTDINLLYDAVRKAIETSASLCESEGLSDWRQSAYNVRCLKKAYRHAQSLKRSKSQDEDKREERAKQIQQAHRNYLALAESFLQRAHLTRRKLYTLHHLPVALLAPLDDYIAHGERQIEQIRRRVLLGERIPHEEKVFSIFQPHTEWINKGKAGVAVELGLRVAVSEDQYGFILNHRVMQRQTDDQVAVPLVEDLAEHFPAVKSVSMDKGFHSPENQRRLAEVIAFPVVPKKGKRSQAQLAHEQDPRFIRLRRRHSGVESAINALEVHGLDLCPDHGIDGFKRYVALAVVGRNLHRLGAILLEQEAGQERRRKRRAA
jgi:IS5 family transposase